MVTPSNPRPLAIVAGAGPGLGATLLDVFDEAGYRAIGLRRNTDGQNPAIVACDLTDAEAVHTALIPLFEHHGPPRLVVHNAAHLVIQPFLETTREEFETCWRAMVQSAFTLAQVALQPMVDGGGGTFIISGATASLRGGARFSAFASAKFALRGLAQSLAREFQPSGVHVVHTILDGIIDTPASRTLHTLDPARMMRPEDIAETYLALARQPRSTWTHEIDLRPSPEAF